MQKEISFRVYYEDTDAQGIVYHANYLKFCERARSEMLLSQNIGGFSDREYFILRSVQADFISPARLNDIITVHTKALQIGASKVILEQSISLNESTIFLAKVTLAYIKDKKPSRLSEQLREFFISCL
ncbi:YbgC/FadM family acyl-CoA thioesterase [Campylobacter sp. 19-13652]|uniref:YbgC/FadM family acyl-CoA thioesterase n=1 Tax=Campylobacter sp. 19-13652 TaxID=2840180 RepID=UPI001C798F87|nr:YbgC/FadM family acyl-CoA thioesterase [Campylobacter sp. 19-13652]BCX79159.1 acyl-CoA thioester hydrolase [Campylobacter sp. 19-13652]